MLVRWLLAEGPLGSFRRGPGLQKDQAVIRVLGLSAPPSGLLGMGEGLEIEFNHQWPVIDSIMSR